MGEIASVAMGHVIEGQPWKDAIISVLEPRSPYRPWHAVGGIEPGHAVIGVLDTDPQSVIAGVGIVGPDGRVDRAPSPASTPSTSTASSSSARCRC